MNQRPEIPGIFYDEDNATYHGRNDCCSFSNLKLLMKSPELYKKHIDGLLTNEVQDYYAIGNAVHTAILEPEKKGEYHFTEEGFKASTKAGKAIKAECEEKGITLLNATNSKIANSCIDALQNDNAIKLFAQGDPEVTFRVKTRTLQLQCRTDWICHSAPTGLEEYGIDEGDRYVADLKTCRTIDDFMADTRWKNPLTNSLLYSGQQVYYSRIIESILSAAGLGKIDKWLFVVVEKEEPFRVLVCSTPASVIDWVTDKINVALNELSIRTAEKNWIDDRTTGCYEPEIRL